VRGADQRDAIAGILRSEVSPLRVADTRTVDLERAIVQLVSSTP
jgi:hypothetical protein